MPFHCKETSLIVGRGITAMVQSRKPVRESRQIQLNITTQKDLRKRQNFASSGPKLAKKYVRRLIYPIFRSVRLARRSNGLNRSFLVRIKTARRLHLRQLSAKKNRIDLNGILVMVQRKKQPRSTKLLISTKKLKAARRNIA